MADKKKYYPEEEQEQETFSEEEAYQEDEAEAAYQTEDYEENAGDVENDEGVEEEESTLETLLGFLTNTLMESKPVPLQSGKRAVNVQMCLDIIEDIRNSVPDDVRWAQSVLEKRKRILSEARAMADSRVKAADARANAALDNANKEAQRIEHEAEDHADKIVKEAQARARAMIDQSEIMRLAHEEADQICEDARADANDQRLNATRYAENLLGELEGDVQATLEAVHRSLENISGKNKKM